MAAQQKRTLTEQELQVLHGLKEARLKFGALKAYFNGTLSEDDRFDPQWVLDGLEEGLLEIGQAIFFS